MKKIYLFAMLILFMFVISGCGLIGTQDLESAREVYQELNEIYIVVDEFASDTYSAWHYGIYDKPHSKTGLASKVSLSSSELNGVGCNLLFFDEFSFTVGCVQNSHEELGNYAEVRGRLDNVRSLIIDLRESRSEEVSNLARDLQSYYITLIELLNLAEDYSGSFNALTNDIRDFRNQAREYKSKLEFDLG